MERASSRIGWFFAKAGAGLLGFWALWQGWDVSCARPMKERAVQRAAAANVRTPYTFDRKHWQEEFEIPPGGETPTIQVTNHSYWWYPVSDGCIEAICNERNVLTECLGSPPRGWETGDAYEDIGKLSTVRFRNPSAERSVRVKLAFFHSSFRAHLNPDNREQTVVVKPSEYVRFSLNGGPWGPAVSRVSIAPRDGCLRGSSPPFDIYEDICAPKSFLRQRRSGSGTYVGLYNVSGQPVTVTVRIDLES